MKMIDADALYFRALETKSWAELIVLIATIEGNTACKDCSKCGHREKVGNNEL